MPVTKMQAMWPYLWKILTSVCLPITIPWIVYRIVVAVVLKRRYASLCSKVVVITGANSGLGESLAHEFYKHGCQIVLCARRRQELERVRQDLMQMHPVSETVPTHQPVIVPLDLTDLTELPNRVKTIYSIVNKVDILVNNAGISYRGKIINTQIDADMRVMMVNYFGQIAFTKAILPKMKECGSGHIVFINSIQGRLAVPHRSAYAASKHALLAFSETLRAEASLYGVKVTNILPGYVKTALSLNAVTGTGKIHGEMDSEIANGYPPEYVAERVVKGVLEGKNEVIIAPLKLKIAIYLRIFIPSIFFKLMRDRARKPL